MVLLLAFALVLLAPVPAFATDFTNVTYHRCYDGDTCTVTIPAVHPLFGEKIRVRIAGIDAPGMRGKCEDEKALAIKAREKVRSLMDKASRIDLRGVARGKYFRIVADIMVAGVSVGTLLIAEGLARSYKWRKT